MNPAIDDTTDAGYQRPRDPVEIWVARQWQDVLGFTVGIRENFFGVGGNSLDAARVINAVLADFGVQLPLNVLTEHPTVERLATVLRDHAERLSGPLVAIDAELLAPNTGTELAQHSDVPAILASWQERDLVPSDMAPEFVARSLRVWQANRDAVRDWQPSPYTGPIDVFGRPVTLPEAAVRRTQCGTDGCLADALRELIG